MTICCEVEGEVDGQSSDALGGTLVEGLRSRAVTRICYQDLANSIVTV